MPLRALVLGSAAGGGFPQWNSAGPGCVRARAGDPAARARTQASIAVSADGLRWAVLNAAPELRLQIEATPALHPRREGGATRHSPIAAVALTGGEVDTIAGLLSLRERQAFALYAAAPTLAVLAANPIFRVLNSDLVPRRELMPRRPVALQDAAGAPLGLTLEAFAVPGKVPLFNEDPAGADPGRSDEGDTVGFAVSAGGGTLLFIPGCAAMTPALRARIAAAQTLLFDGTLFRDDEMIAAGVGTKTGARMGHMSLDGPGGTLAALDGIPARRILIHLNNTNPVLLADSRERAIVAAAGWEVAEDGMEITVP
jgi:pyrroloquinoline quinone biosynthesis protein B